MIIHLFNFDYIYRSCSISIIYIDTNTFFIIELFSFKKKNNMQRFFQSCSKVCQFITILNFPPNNFKIHYQYHCLCLTATSTSTNEEVMLILFIHYFFMVFNFNYFILELFLFISSPIQPITQPATLQPNHPTQPVTMPDPRTGSGSTKSNPCPGSTTTRFSA